MKERIDKIIAKSPVRNIKLRWKFFVSFGLLILLSLMTIYASIGGLKRVKEIESSNEKNLQIIMEVTNIEKNLLEINNIVLRDDFELNIKSINRMKFLMAENEVALINYNNIIDVFLPGEEEVFEEFKDKYNPYIGKVSNMLNAQNKLMVKQLYDSNVSDFGFITNKLYTLIDMNRVNYNMNKEASLKLHKDIVKSVIGIFIALILVTFLVSTYMSFSVTHLLDKIKVLLNLLANYDLTHKVDSTRKDEFGDVLRSVEDIRLNLVTITSALYDSTNGLNESSQDLSSIVSLFNNKFNSIKEDTSNISKVIEEETSSIQEITASIEEINGGMEELSSEATNGSLRAYEIKENSKNAISINKEYRLTTEKLYKEKEENIKVALEDIKVVDQIQIMSNAIADIAEQTNLLSLNAAIEAARAGEHGRGFSVVAEEVGKLADEVSSTAGKINELVREVRGSVTNLTGNSNELLSFIESLIRENFDILMGILRQYEEDADFINNMSEHMASMSEEITATMNQLTMNADNVAKESENASHSVNRISDDLKEADESLGNVFTNMINQQSLARQLNEIVDKFKI